MKPETRTVTQLFELAVRYEVPLYQRPYVWKEEDQWQPMWEDICVLLDHQRSPAASQDGVWSHFLGAIVLEQELTPPGSLPTYTVIDGQQRLTTLQILLAAASNVVDEHGASNDAAILKELVRNNPLKASGTDVFKVWPTNANRPAFTAVLAPGGPDASRVDDPDNLIDEAYDFFKAAIEEMLTEEPEADRPDVISLLRVTLCDLLRVVAITLEHGDNAQIIFETLNARGTPLLALDLVKNAAFHLAQSQDVDVDELYEEVWKPQLDDDYWRKEQRQGRLYRPRADLFLMHWLAMKLRRIIPATELFSTFRKDMLQRPEPADAEALVRELCRDASVMRSFDDFPKGSPEAVFFERLKALDVTTVMPLVLFLFREPSISVDTRRRCLRILESWLTRRALTRMTTKNYSQQVPVLIERIAEGDKPADTVLLEELRSGEGEASRWPTDEDVERFLSQFGAYNNIARRRLLMALEALELSMYTHGADVVSLAENLTIEHVMPQSWKKNWPLPTREGASKQEAIDAREAHIHKLGNLTLTVGALNTRLSNAAWDKKQVALNKESKLLLNTHLIADNPYSFDEAAIDQRTSDLVGRLCSIWPGPGNEWGA